ncbi:ABC transporter ATP-binding protein [Paenibacillus ehimensis]|uniref:ABC transporter ATP-binding protein n=1 Tax=Paenibacillus ehimensis TaxID=79264 RepID=UPI002DBFD94C|nr:ABC transporter ATP-binding protein [Paenibacillus ehimensis]MEC0208732.1 ABC transporter ATP-binding protein [Paenibacillus ehimensis]
MKKLLEVSGLCVALKRTAQPIVNNVSFTLRAGTALAIVGESGSGKTMTCKAIMQLLDASRFRVSGNMQYGEEKPISMDDKRIRALCGTKIAMIVQNPMTAFDPTAKIGAQIVETIRAHQQISRRDAYASGVLALENMNLPRCEQLMNSYPYELSGGMLQRIMIALSLINGPEIIIADEATTALDVNNQSIILNELEKMKRSGIGLLLVTHDFGVAAKLADEMIVMRKGEIIESGTVYDIFAAPREPYTKELLAASILAREDRHD